VNAAIRYLALGDSYSIGTGASDNAHNFPSIVAASCLRQRASRWRSPTPQSMATPRSI